jgi:glycosyltransferase involved in cell wall biosynthesis
MHNGVDKKTLFTHLAEAEYFIYPLYTPYKDVHKDTFSCVVAEAIALGCTVVTYPLGALPENFNEFCYWLPAPEGVDFNKMNTEPLSRDEEGIFNTSEPIVAALNYLDSRKDYRDQLTAKGNSTMVSRFSTETIGKKWVNFINELINE